MENVALPSQMIANPAASFRLGLPIQLVPVSTTPHYVTAKSPAGIQVLPASVHIGFRIPALEAEVRVNPAINAYV